MKTKLTFLLLPFSRTFSEMALNKRWWHRLAVVVYFLAIPVFAGMVWLLRAEVPYHASWTQPKWINGRETQEAVEKRIGHRVYEAADKVVFFGPDGTLRLVQYNLVKEAIENGGHRAIPMTFDDQTFGYIPDNRFSEASKNGGRVVGLPDGYVLKSASVEDDIPYWYLQRHPKWWQILAELYAIVALATLVFSYSLQFAYRALVYIALGSQEVLH
jgi:hypothetical protein